MTLVPSYLTPNTHVNDYCPISLEASYMLDNIPPVGLSPYWHSALEQGNPSWKARRARQSRIISVERFPLEPLCLQTQTAERAMKDAFPVLK